MNVARLNFSHGNHEEHQRRIQMIREAADSLGRDIAIMLDTRGAEIRTQKLDGGAATLRVGEPFLLYSEDRPGDARGVSVSHPVLFDHVVPGTRILIDDGALELRATEISGKGILCEVVRGGTLADRKSINIPDIRFPRRELSERDRRDIAFAVDNDITYIAASFIRSAKDVLDVRNLVQQSARYIPIIAKIENREGVENLDEIIQCADGMMVARGDLGVEVPLEDVPTIQKKIIHSTVRAGKPVITATQMLDSMTRNPTPTRAEVSDVANAIFDGTSAVMLSGETANGMYPVESVRTMHSLALRAEESLGEFGHLQQSYAEPEHRVTDAVSHAAITMAARLNAAAIVTLTESGFTSRSISKFRPQCPILAVTASRDVVCRLALNWGVTSLHLPGHRSDDEIMRFAITRGCELGYLRGGDILIVTHGTERESGSTSLVRVLNVMI